jgi:hypothetical protein
MRLHWVRTFDMLWPVESEHHISGVEFFDQNAGRSYHIKIGNNFFESVEEFKYLGTNLTNQNFI